MLKLANELLNGKRTVLQARYRMTKTVDVADLNQEEEILHTKMVNAIQSGKGRMKLTYDELV